MPTREPVGARQGETKSTLQHPPARVDHRHNLKPPFSREYKPHAVAGYRCGAFWIGRPSPAKPAIAPRFRSRPAWPAAARRHQPGAWPESRDPIHRRGNVKPLRAHRPERSAMRASMGSRKDRRGLHALDHSGTPSAIFMATPISFSRLVLGVARNLIGTRRPVTAFH